MLARISLKDIITKEILEHNAALLKRKRIMPGFDGMSVSGAVSWISINGNRLCKDILDGDYSPMPAIGFTSAKSNGGYRNLSKLSVIDCVIQNSIRQALTPVFESEFSDNSFAYRIGRGVSGAVERYIYLAKDNRYAAHIDFEACFDNINHEKLCGILREFHCDKALIELMHAYMKMPVSADGEIITRSKGLLQGSPLSPLLCNVYFHVADRYMEKENIQFIRYADDIVVMSDSVDKITAILKQLENFFKEELFLNFNRKKTKISNSSDFVFLGQKFSRTRKGLIAIENDTDEKVDYYYQWNSDNPMNNRRRIDILSDGILRRRDFSILFDTDVKDTIIPPVSTDILNVYSNIVFDSGFFGIASQNGITVNMFDNNGSYIGRFEPASPLKSPSVIHQQLMEYYEQKSRLYLAKEFLLASIHNCVLNIRYYNKHMQCEKYIKALEYIDSIKRKIKVENNIDDILILEAGVRKTYYECYDLFSKREEFRFEKRTRKPPQNKLNALLSFGNVVLYNYIASQIRKTSLDVRVGYLHATTGRELTLNLDIAEIFKPLLVDRTIFSLINKGSLSGKHFSADENGAVYLTREGKNIFLNGFYKKLETKITVKNENLSYKQVIDEEIRKLVRHFKNKDKYAAFRQVR